MDRRDDEMWSGVLRFVCYASFALTIVALGVVGVALDVPGAAPVEPGREAITEAAARTRDGVMRILALLTAVTGLALLLVIPALKPR